MTKYEQPIIVNEITYKVVHKEAVTVDGEEVKGLIRPDLAQIEMKNKLAQSVYNQTLMHEIVHAIRVGYCIHAEDGDEERAVDCMASGFLSIVRHNPELIKFFMEAK